MGKELESRTTGIGESPALLIVDAIRGFTDPSSPLGSDFCLELKNIQKLIDHARSKDWPCFFSTVVYHSADQASVFREKLPALDTLTPDSDYVEIDPELSMNESDRLIEKQYASCFFGTDLADQLKSSGRDSVIVTGFTTSGCVRASAVDALQYNFRTLVVEDAVGDRDTQAHAANLKDLRIKYTDVTDTNTLLRL